MPSASIIFFEESKETLSASSLYPSLIIKTDPVARIFPLSLIYSILSASRIFSLFWLDLRSLIGINAKKIKYVKKVKTVSI